jgi:hypothetical protein
MAEFVLDPVEKAGARLRIQNIRFDGRHTQLIRSRGERCRIAPVIATRAPSATNRRAAARPFPLFPPVIRAVLPFNNIELTSYLAIMESRVVIDAVNATSRLRCRIQNYDLLPRFDHLVYPVKISVSSVACIHRYFLFWL